jgi:hypothetical protein
MERLRRQEVVETCVQIHIHFQKRRIAMFKLTSFALALSLLMGATLFAADGCCGDPACCASGCCKNCTH